MVTTSTSKQNELPHDDSNAYRPMTDIAFKIQFNNEFTKVQRIKELGRMFPDLCASVLKHFCQLCHVNKAINFDPWRQYHLRAGSGLKIKAGLDKGEFRK